MPYKNPPKSTRFHIGTSGNPFILRMLVDIAMQRLRQKGTNNATES